MDTFPYLLGSVEKSKVMRQITTYHRLGYLYRAHPLYTLANLPPFFFLRKDEMAVMFDIRKMAYVQCRSWNP